MLVRVSVFLHTLIWIYLILQIRFKCINIWFSITIHTWLILISTVKKVLSVFLILLTMLLEINWPLWVDGGGALNRLFWSLEVFDDFLVNQTLATIFLTGSNMGSRRFFCLDIVDDSDFYLFFCVFASLVMCNLFSAFLPFYPLTYILISQYQSLNACNFVMCKHIWVLVYFIYIEVYLYTCKFQHKKAKPQISQIWARVKSFY